MKFQKMFVQKLGSLINAHAFDNWRVGEFLYSLNTIVLHLIQRLIYLQVIIKGVLTLCARCVPF